MTRILLIIGILWATMAQGALRYVDKDDGACTDAGSGLTGAPYCTTQAAFDDVNAGDSIRIRPASTPYDQNTDLTRSGTVISRIVIESDPATCASPYTNPATCPILRNSVSNSSQAPIRIRANYITVQNLTFDGAGVNTPDYAIDIQATTVWNEDLNGVINGATAGADIQDPWIIGNTFKNWGGDTTAATVGRGRWPLSVNGGFCVNRIAVGQPARGCTWRVFNAIVQGNTFDNNRMRSMQILHADNTVVENNTFLNNRCGRDSDTATNTVGIHILDSSESGTTMANGTIIRQNLFHDFQTYAACDVPNVPGSFDTTVAIWCDVGPINGLVERNLIYNLNSGNATCGPPCTDGILIEVGCRDWTVRNNVVHHVGYTGIAQRTTNDRFNPTNWPTAVNNFYNNTVAFAADRHFAMGAGRFRAKNNLFIGANPVSAMMSLSVPAPAGYYEIDYNLYHDTTVGDVNTAQWDYDGAGPALSLATWRSTYGFDLNGIYTASPNLVNVGADDLRPCIAAGNPVGCVGASPAINAGVTLANVTDDFTCDPPAACVTRPQGSAYDIGAYEMVTAEDVTPPAAPTNLRVVSP